MPEANKDELFEVLNGPFWSMVEGELKKMRDDAIEEIATLDFTDESARFKASKIQGGIEFVDNVFEYVNSLKKEEER